MHAASKRQNSLQLSRQGAHLEAGPGGGLPQLDGAAVLGDRQHAAVRCDGGRHHRRRLPRHEARPVERHQLPVRALLLLRACAVNRRWEVRLLAGSRWGCCFLLLCLGIWELCWLRDPLPLPGLGHDA